MTRHRAVVVGCMIYCGLLISFSNTAAAPGWIGQAASATPADVTPDDDAVTLLREIECSVDAKLGFRWRERRVVRILRSGGLGLATFTFDLEPGEDLRALRVWTVGPGRESTAGKRDVVESTFSPDFYTDVRRVALRAPRAEVGDVVAIECAGERRLEFASWIWWPQLDEHPVHRARFSVQLPKGWSLEHRATGVTPQASVAADGKWLLETGPLRAVSSEPSGPLLTAVMPRISLRFRDASGAAPFEDWRAVAAWYHGLAAPRYSSVPEALLAGEGVGGSSRVSAIGALARRVQQEVRYAAVELGRQRWEPDEASTTWLRRYGDCKDKAVLLAAALEARGITARPVLAASRVHRQIDPAAPDPWQFNHCIVAMIWPDGPGPPGVSARGPSGRTWTFFDPTSTEIPLGLLPADEAGTWAVIADPDEGLIRLPEGRGSRIECDTRAQIIAGGEMACTTRIHAEGTAGLELAARLTEGTEAERRDCAAGLMSGPWRSPQVESVSCAIDSAGFSMRAELRFRLRDAWQSRGDGRHLWPPVILSHRQAPPTDTLRWMPVHLGGPLEITQRVIIEWTGTLRPDSLADVNWNAAAGEFRMSRRRRANGIEITRVLRLNEPMIAAERYGEVLGIWRAAYQGDMAPVILRQP